MGPGRGLNIEFNRIADRASENNTWACLIRRVDNTPVYMRYPHGEGCTNIQAKSANGPV